MNGKIIITNLKGKENVQKAISEIKPDKIIIISPKKLKFMDFEVETSYLRVKNEFEDFVHEIHSILTTGGDFTIIAKPDKTGMYLLWLAQMSSINPTYIMSHGELQQIPIIRSVKLSQKESDILKLADCHGFMDPKSINKEFGIPEEEAKKYLEKLSKMGIFQYIVTKEFKAGEEKVHAYYITDLLEKHKEAEDMYLMTELGRIVLYLTLTGEK